MKTNLLFAFFLPLFMCCCSEDSSSNSENFTPDESGAIDLGDGFDGEMRLGTDSTTWYVFEDSVWRLAQDQEISLGFGCTNKLNGSLQKIGDQDYVCNWIMESENSIFAKWDYASISNYKKGDFFNPAIKYGSITDSRDDHTYKTVEIDGLLWMAENLNFNTGDTTTSKCPLNRLEETCEQLGRLYTWRSAMGLSETLDTSITIEKEHQGICMTDWHIPDSTEWNKVLNSAKWPDFQSSIGWNKGTNESGFSVIPTMYDDGGTVKYPTLGIGVIRPYQGYGSAFLASTEYRYDTSSTSTLTGHEKGFSLTATDSRALIQDIPVAQKIVSVRCVKNR